MYCTNCGVKVPLNANFCGNCGAPQAGGDTPTSQRVGDDSVVPDFLKGLVEFDASAGKYVFAGASDHEATPPTEMPSRGEIDEDYTTRPFEESWPLLKVYFDDWASRYGFICIVYAEDTFIGYPELTFALDHLDERFLWTRLDIGNNSCLERGNCEGITSEDFTGVPEHIRAFLITRLPWVEGQDEAALVQAELACHVCNPLGDGDADEDCEKCFGSGVATYFFNDDLASNLQY